MARDLYDVLGVAKDADEDVVRKSYRKLAAKFHPDRNPGKENEDRFKEITAAYEILSNKDKRTLYDEFGEESTRQGFDAERARAMRNFGRRGAGRGGGGGSVSFQDIFGGGAGDFGDIVTRQQGGAPGARRGPRRAPDMEAQVEIDFVSSIRGTMVELAPSDGGEAVTVRIPPGASDGSRLRIAGQGAKIPGAHPGDLLLTVHVRPHPIYKREGDDLHLDLPVTLVEAYEGAKVRVPTPEGDVTLKVPAKTQSGQIMRLRGKGVARKGKPPGDLYVRFLITIPTDETPEVVEAIETLRKHLGDPRGAIKL
jgi:curved DNA-binding protein